MSDPPPGDEQMRLVQRDKSLPRLLHTAAVENEQTGEDSANQFRPEETARGRLSFVGSLVLVTLAFSVGFSYLWEKGYLRRAAPTETPVVRGAALEAPVSASTSATPALFPLNADMLHVTAIALGQSRLAIVNDQRVAEGESLEVNTSAGVATVRVDKIEDGMVRFAYGNDSIEVKLNPAGAQKPPP